MSEAIVAAATPQVPSAIGILRLSGDGVIPLVDKLFTPRGGRRLAEAPDRTLLYGTLCDGAGRPLDQVLATVSRSPHSYTGEDTAELQCHGSPAVLALALNALCAAGARMAQPGEFTRRAFLNGRLDLTAAEAVMDLIDAETEEAVHQAAGQLSGALCRKIDGIYDALVDVMAHFHAVLDYPDEDIDPFRMEELAAALTRQEQALDALLAACGRGRQLREGVPCAIVGRPNAGKSSLLNTLVGYDRAIVTDIPGTTRDTVEERCTLGGVTLRLIDTAGLRESADPVEQLGVARSRAAMEGAELIFVLWDSAVPATEEDAALLEQARAIAPTVLVRTKTDLPAALAPFPALPAGLPTVELSVKTGRGLDALETAVAALFPRQEDVPCGQLLTNARQEDAARRARDSIVRARDALTAGMTPDALLTDVEEALSALGELTGKTVRSDITDRIFSRFCVGK